MVHLGPGVPELTGKGFWKDSMNSLLRIAFRNVLRNRRRSIITFSAVFLALGVMVGLRGFLNGMQATIRESVILGQTGALQVHRKGFLKSVNTSSLDLDLPTDEAFMGRILGVKGVKAATARIAFGGMANANDTSAVALFSAYILYDINRIVHGGEDNYITATLAVYLDIYNVFVSLLQLLMAFTGDRD